MSSTFHAFWSDIMAETIAYFARVAKAKTHSAKVVGAFYAYPFEFAEPGEDAGHLALHRLLLDSKQRQVLEHKLKTGGKHVVALKALPGWTSIS